MSHIILSVLPVLITMLFMASSYAIILWLIFLLNINFFFSQLIRFLSLLDMLAKVEKVICEIGGDMSL